MFRNLLAAPYDVRVLAGSNIDQARVTFTQWMDAAAEATSIWLNALPENEMTSRFKAIQHRAISYGKQNVEAALAFASELTNAEDFQDVLAKQSRYAQTQIQNYDLQAQELGRLMVGTANLQPSA